MGIRRYKRVDQNEGPPQAFSVRYLRPKMPQESDGRAMLVIVPLLSAGATVSLVMGTE